MGLKWFHFDDGSNPYGVWGERTDEFFRMIVAWQPTMIDNNTFRCPAKPKEAYFHVVDYQYKKEALREFAKEYQRIFPHINSTWEDVIWFSSFFEQYGRKYGLLKEFRENGIC